MEVEEKVQIIKDSLRTKRTSKLHNQRWIKNQICSPETQLSFLTLLLYPHTISITIQEANTFEETIDSTTNLASNDQEALAYATTQLHALDSDIRRICTTENRGIDVVQTFVLVAKF